MRTEYREILAALQDILLRLLAALRGLFLRLLETLRSLLIRIISPDFLGTMAVGSLLCWVVGVPFGDALSEYFLFGSIRLVPAVPAAVEIAAVSSLALCIALVSDTAFMALVAGFVSTRLLFSGVFLNHSRLKWWELLGLSPPWPRFNADGPGMIFLVVFGAWALFVLHRFHAVREELRRSGAEERDIEGVSCFLAVFQTGGLLLLGGAAACCLALLA